MKLKKKTIKKYIKKQTNNNKKMRIKSSIKIK